eukprot:178509-Alexandrium_andersonii.AAC.1
MSPPPSPRPGAREPASWLVAPSTRSQAWCTRTSALSAGSVSLGRSTCSSGAQPSGSSRVNSA